MEVESAILSPGRRPLVNLTLGSPLRVKKNATQLGLGPLRSPVLHKSKRPLSPEDKEKLAPVYMSSLGTPSRVRVGGMRHTAEDLENNSMRTNQQCRTPSEVSAKQSTLQIKDFTVGKAIGKGKFGNVYLATAKEGTLGCATTSLAMKVLSKAQLQQESANGMKTVMNEVDILEALNHPNIVRFYGFCEDSRSFYLIMEHLPQGELFKVVRQMGGRVTEAACIGYLRQITAAVAHMHRRGVVHRDIKPENILVDTEGALKLADFGTAARVRPPDDHLLAVPEALRYTRCGTPEYLSPEMVAGAGHGTAADMWALGVMIYELLYGCTPFVEYETAPSQPTTPGSHRAQAPAPTPGSRRVNLSGVLRRIAAHTGELPFPEPMEGISTHYVSVQSTLAVTPRKMDRQNSLIRSVFSPAAALPARPRVQPVSTPSPPRRSFSTLPSEDHAEAVPPANIAARSARSARAQRVPLRLDSPSRPAVTATPTKCVPSRGLSSNDSGRRAAVPTRSEAVVSEDVKRVILQLLQPSPAERLAADELLSCAWLCAS